MTYLFAINPVSGGRDKSDWEEAIRAYFADLPHTAHLFHLNGQTDDELIRQQIAQHQPDRVVAVGGDGTLKSVATQLLGTGMPLGLLPAGSANGMARELGIPPDAAGSLDVLVNGTPKAIDVISVNDDICLHLSDIGLNARVVMHYQQNNWRGMFGYVRAVLKALRKRRLLQVEINLGDVCVQRAALMVVLANARMYGTGAVINPDGDLSDGQFEVVVFRRLSVWEIIKLFWRYKPFNAKHIEIFPATSITVSTRRKAYFQVDGEYRGRVGEVNARVLPGALQVLMPAL
ncbi:diacylglycerol/lipid kinase family protein [Spirosoma montaniterrae]|uniref:Diacylglycerol kinase n=1 Tax=Spirosoma montaniterrae TaxID=1178516 RepID=A0A1P9WYI2_9BACT|nr:diacylglycerol kinase family protein [Spirosoma montaniterrae]AQG80429.1 diacylglycerol kinase [Spirosoma montaniterrae]